jgi:hypothetical protein
VRSFAKYMGNQNKEDEMGGQCSTHDGDEKCIQNIDLKGGENVEDLEVNNRIILKRILGK